MSLLKRFCLLGFAILVAWFFAHGASRTVPRTITYAFTLQNTTNRMLRGVELEVYAPMQATAFQELKNLKASHPYQVKTDKLGIQLLSFKIDELAPNAAEVIRVTADLNLSERARHAGSARHGRFLSSEKFVEVSAPEIQAIAKRIPNGASDIETARHIFEWVKHNVKYAGYIREDLGARYAAINHRGDCTEFSFLFTALSRAKGIPARAVDGFLVRKNSSIGRHDYHAWAEVLLDGAWRIVDPSESVFLNHQSDYIALRIVTENADTLIPGTNAFYSAPEKVRVTLLD